MKYTKHQIKRIKMLNEKYFEVVFEKHGLNFAPGSSVKLYKGTDYPLFLASGVQEPWIRIIFNGDLFGAFYEPSGGSSTSIKLDPTIDNPFPTLMSEAAPAFILDADTVGVFFSWASTYPTVKCDVCYMGDNKVQEDWIKANHNLVSASKVTRENLYVMGRRENLTGKARSLINNCKGSFVIE